MRELDRVERFGKRADLIDLDQDGIGHALVDSFAEKLDVRHKKIVADELDFFAQPLGQFLPAVPIVLRATILD